MIGDLIVGVVEGCGALAQLVVESMGFAVDRLSKNPGEGKRHLSTKRVVIALLPLTLLVGSIGGWIGYEYWQSRSRVRTQTLVAQWSEKLADQRGPDGRVIRVAGTELPVRDAWNQPLRVRYEQHEIADTIRVWSIGRDAKSDTHDDIESSKNVWLPKQAAGAAMRKLGQQVKQRLPFARD